MAFENYSSKNKTEAAKQAEQDEATRLSGQRLAGSPKGPLEKLKDNYLSKEGWQRRADRWLSRSYNKVAHEATTMGEYIDDQGVKYKPDREGVFRAVSRGKNGAESINEGRPLEVDGRPVKAMSGMGKDFYEGRHSAQGIEKADLARSADENNKFNENMKKFAGLDESELFSRAAITSDDDNKRAIYMTLLSKGGFRPKDEAVMAEAKRLFAAKPRLAQEFMKLVKEKAPWALYDHLPDKGSGQRESLAGDFKSGKLKLSSYNVEGGRPSVIMAAQDTAYDALGPAEYARQNKALRKQGSAESRQEVARAQLAAARARNEHYLNELSRQVYAEYYQGSLAAGDGKETAERKAAAQVVGQAEEIMKKVLADRKSFVLRAAAADLAGDLKKSFTYDTPKGRIFNEAAVRDYLQYSTADTIASIDLSTEKDPQVINSIISSLSGSQIIAAIKAQANQENVVLIARLMARNNHPDAEKLQDYYNSLPVDSDQLRANAAVADLIAKSSGIFEDKLAAKHNLQLLNMLRENHQALGLLEYDNKGLLTKESFDKSLAQTKVFMTRLATHLRNGGTVENFKGPGGRPWSTKSA